MSVRGINPRNLSKVIDRVTAPSIQDLNSAIAQAINTLFAQYCRKVDPAGDCIAAPADPQLIATNFAIDVLVNAYPPTEMVPGQPNLPRFNFMANLRPPYTMLFHGRLMKNVALAIAGFVVASLHSPFPVTAINVYKAAGTPNLWKTAPLYMSTPIELPNLLPSELPVKAYLALLNEPVIIPPDSEVVLEAVVHPAYPPNVETPIQAWIMWVPPIVFTARSAYNEAIAPRQPPML